MEISMAVRQQAPNGPKLWSAILERFPPNAVIAGGAVRDYLLGFEHADIDVFFGEEPQPDPVEFDHFFEDPRRGLDYIEDYYERKEEYAAFSDILLISKGRILGHRVDAVLLAQPVVGVELVETFDFGITRCWFDGFQVFDTPEARYDRQNRVMTLLNAERGEERSIKRFERLNERWGGDWRLVR